MRLFTRVIHQLQLYDFIKLENTITYTTTHQYKQYNNNTNSDSADSTITKLVRSKGLENFLNKMEKQELFLWTKGRNKI